MWALILPVISQLFGEKGPIGQFFKTRAATAQANAEYNLQVEKARIEYATKMAEAAVTSQANQLAATSQSFKAFSYVFLTLPIIIVCIWPDWGKEIFSNLGLIPVWYAQLYVAVVGVIWGLPIAASAVSGIFTAIQTSWDAARHYKIEKIEKLGKATEIGYDAAKKDIFDTIRKTTGVLSQAQVDALNPIVEKAVRASIEQQGK